MFRIQLQCGVDTAWVDWNAKSLTNLKHLYVKGTLTVIWLSNSSVHRKHGAVRTCSPDCTAATVLENSPYCSLHLATVSYVRFRGVFAEFKDERSLYYSFMPEEASAFMLLDQKFSMFFENFTEADIADGCVILVRTTDMQVMARADVCSDLVPDFTNIQCFTPQLLRSDKTRVPS